MIMTKEQIDTLTYTQCQKAIKQLVKDHDFEKELIKLPKEARDMVDEVTNTFLWLEDRIKLFEDPRIPSMNPGQPIVKPPPAPRVKTGRPARKYRIGDKVYNNIHEAVMKTGIKLQTLKTYVSRHSDRYGYVD